jgi:hypothetical protein
MYNTRCKVREQIALSDIHIDMIDAPQTSDLEQIRSSMKIIAA